MCTIGLSYCAKCKERSLLHICMNNTGFGEVLNKCHSSQLSQDVHSVLWNKQLLYITTSFNRKDDIKDEGIKFVADSMITINYYHLTGVTVLLPRFSQIDWIVRRDCFCNSGHFIWNFRHSSSKRRSVFKPESVENKDVWIYYNDVNWREFY